MTLFGIPFTASNLWPLVIPLVALAAFVALWVISSARRGRAHQKFDAEMREMNESIARGYREIDTANRLVRQALAGQFSLGGRVVEIGDGFYVVNDGAERVVFVQPDQAEYEPAQCTKVQIAESASVARQMSDRVLAALDNPPDERRTLH